MAELDHLAREVALLRWVKQQRDRLKEIEADPKAAVEAALGDDEVGTINGEEAITWKFSKPNKFREAKFKADHPEEHAAYVLPPEKPQRTFLIKDE